MNRLSKCVIGITLLLAPSVGFGQSGGFPPEATPVIDGQQLFYDTAFVADYDPYADFVLFLDRAPLQSRVETYYATRANGETIDITSLKYDAVDLGTTGTETAAVVIGRHADVVEFVGLYVGFDNELTAEREHCLVIANARILGPEPDPVMPNLPPNNGPLGPADPCAGAADCMLDAFLDFDLCMIDTNDNWSDCLVENGLLQGGAGALVGCLSGAASSGISHINWAAVLIGCGLGALLGSLLTILGCYDAYMIDVNNCRNALNNRIQSCMDRYDGCYPPH